MGKHEVPSARLARELQDSVMLHILLDLVIQTRCAQLHPGLDQDALELKISDMRTEVLEEIKAETAKSIAALPNAS